MELKVTKCEVLHRGRHNRMHQHVMDGRVLHTGRQNRMHQYVMDGRVLHTGRHNRMHQYVMDGRVLHTGRHNRMHQYEWMKECYIQVDITDASICNGRTSVPYRLVGWLFNGTSTQKGQCVPTVGEGKITYRYT